MIRHSLRSAGSVESAMQKLLDKDIITEIEGLFGNGQTLCHVDKWYIRRYIYLLADFLYRRRGNQKPDGFEPSGFCTYKYLSRLALFTPDTLQFLQLPGSGRLSERTAASAALNISVLTKLHIANSFFCGAQKTTGVSTKTLTLSASLVQKVLLTVEWLAKPLNLNVTLSIL